MPVRAKAAIPGLLTAARAEDSVLGLACSHPLADRGATERFLASVKAAAADSEHARPLFLQAGPVRVAKPKPEGVAVQQVRRFVRENDAPFQRGQRAQETGGDHDPSGGLRGGERVGPGVVEYHQRSSGTQVPAAAVQPDEVSRPAAGDQQPPGGGRYQQHRARGGDLGGNRVGGP